MVTGAAGAALVVLHGDQVLLALHGVTGEGDAQAHHVVGVLHALCVVMEIIKGEEKG